jgi:hypothetical protein
VRIFFVMLNPSIWVPASGFLLFLSNISRASRNLPDGVAGAQTNPLGDGAVLTLSFGKLLLGAEGLVALLTQGESAEIILLSKRSKYCGVTNRHLDGLVATASWLDGRSCRPWGADGLCAGRAWLSLRLGQVMFPVWPEAEDDIICHASKNRILPKAENYLIRMPPIGPNSSAVRSSVVCPPRIPA